ncbi:MAG: lysine--tRNA ligase, partial [Candidatus Competibacterales bacterium]|nr:lysine--tRNA ligase [Candidatus Competibacterales bacterium]
MTEADDNKLIAERRARLAVLRRQGEAFPNTFRRDSQAGELQQRFGALEREALEQEDRRFAVSGRLMARRGPFLVLQDGSGQIQLYVDRKVLPVELQEAIRHWDIGDIVGARGPLRKSGKGSLYVAIEQAQLLTKSLRPLPEKYHGLSDQELRYRQRYVDLIVNERTRETFRIRSATIDHIRRFFNAHGFLEVETPMMQPIPGGAVARPFVTHHNALDMPLYLRIAPELYLKRLVVGGLERVYEINRNFRNEGLSTRHNPEFTMLEFYWAYADYRDLMDLTETLLRDLVSAVLGTTRVEYQGTTLDFGAPFERLTLAEAVLRHNPQISPAELADPVAARAHAERLGAAVPDGSGPGGVQLALFEETVEPRLQRPTFITAFPIEVSP